MPLHALDCASVMLSTLLAFALNSGGNAFMFMDFVRARAHIGPACLAWSLCTLCAELPPYQAMTNAYS